MRRLAIVVTATPKEGGEENLNVKLQSAGLSYVEILGFLEHARSEIIKLNQERNKK